MNAIELLKKYKKRLDPFLADYFEQKVEQAREIDPLAVQAVKAISDFTLSGGKRVRPALVYYGYLACGGRDSKEIVEASMAIELIHSFLLIHDDIIDRDEKRHGVPTIHERYKKISLRLDSEKDAQHFGNSMAIIVGDLAYSMANEIMFNAKFSPEAVIRGLNVLQDIVRVIIPGEMMDVVLENRGRATEKEILRMFEGKTSSYTFEGPLHLGCALAGKDRKNLPHFSAYATPIGKAFQIRDDILGVFGDEKKMGKPVGSDVIEGKQTLLFARAMKNASPAQKKDLLRFLGKKDLTMLELEMFRDIIKNTGSLEYSQDLARKFVAESLEALKKIEFKNREAEGFLRGIAEYIIERQS